MTIQPLAVSTYGAANESANVSAESARIMNALAREAIRARLARRSR